jgi:hypothetical protein
MAVNHIHNPMTGEQCRHCDENTEFVLWGFVQSIDGLPARERTTPYHSDSVSVHYLIATKHLSIAAEDMDAHDIVHQYNNVNGGEAWLTERSDPAPWWGRRTHKNSDGTDPKLWGMFFENEAEAKMWLDAGQVDEIEAGSWD